MSVPNLQWLAGHLSEKFKSADDYATWLDKGVKGIVLEEKWPSAAFEPGKHIIGILDGSTGGRSWKEDIDIIRDALPPEHQAFLDSGLAQSLANVSAEPDANNPFRNGQRNPERLAISFLSLARTLKSSPCRDVLDTVEKNFPSSQAVQGNVALARMLIPES